MPFNYLFIYLLLNLFISLFVFAFLESTKLFMNHNFINGRFIVFSLVKDYKGAKSTILVLIKGAKRHVGIDGNPK